jgi:hypothetical protein
MAQDLANAHDTAVRFARNMRRILVGMRDIEQAILGPPSTCATSREIAQVDPERRKLG